MPETIQQDKIANLLDVASQIKGMDWLVTKAKNWGITINPNLDDAIAKPASVPTITPKTFTLRSASHKEGRYMLTYPSVAYNLGKNHKSF